MPYIIPADEAQAFLLDSNLKKLPDSLDRYLRVSGGAGVVMPGHNGGGALADAIECITTSELNGGYELAMSYPMDALTPKSSPTAASSSRRIKTAAVYSLIEFIEWSKASAVCIQSMRGTSCRPTSLASPSARLLHLTPVMP